MVACCMCCVFDSRPAETFVKFCPAKPGVVWSILSLENFNFCNAGFHCQCFVFMHLLHPNPTPNSICLEPSCLTPCQPDEFTLPLDLSTSLWTIPQQETRLGQHFGTVFSPVGSGSTGFRRRFRRRFQEALVQIQVKFHGFRGRFWRTQWTRLDILKLFVVQMVDGFGDRREQNKSNCGWKLNCAFSTLIYVYFAPLFMFLVPRVHFLQFAEARRCHRNCPK